MADKKPDPKPAPMNPATAAHMGPDPKPSTKVEAADKPKADAPKPAAKPKAADPKMQPDVSAVAPVDEPRPSAEQIEAEAPDSQLPTNYTPSGAAEPITDDHISPDEQQTFESGEDYRARTGKT